MGLALGRKWAVRVCAVLLLGGAAGGLAAFNWTAIEVRYAAHRLASAEAEEGRTRYAQRLVAKGEPGLAALTEFLDSEDAGTRETAAAVLAEYLETLVAGDPRAVRLCGRIVNTLRPADAATSAVALELVPLILRMTGSGHAEQCREVVTAALRLPSVDHRTAAIHIALHPHLGMRADLLPLLNAPEAEVRRAALFAVGPATDGEPVIGDEELFRWLHDPDEGVRKVCVASLASRGRSDAEIALGRRLSHPQAPERLKLLIDLRHDDNVRDAEPWLERLSRDSDPAVRAGSVRVAVELAAERQFPVPPWVVSLADADPDLTVRRVARYYRNRAGTGGREIRTVGAP